MMDHPDLFVIGRLLEGLTAGPLRRTQLQQRAGLNYTVFLRYLDYLAYLKLVIVLPGEEARLELTPKGIEAYRFLSDGLSRVFGLSDGGRRTSGSRLSPPTASTTEPS